VGSWQFALRTPTSGNTGFHRESFSSFARRSTKASPCGDLRRLLTSRAHRLGKPHRTFEPLTPSVTRWSRLAALLTLTSAPYGKPHGPPHQAPVRAAFRLKTTAPPGPGRLLLGIDPLPRGRSRLARAPFDVRPRSPRTRSSTANRSPGVKPVDRHGRLPRPPTAPLTPFRQAGPERACGAQWGRCVFPDLQPNNYTSTLRIA
jgi:hypothetical protein